MKFRLAALSLLVISGSACNLSGLPFLAAPQEQEPISFATPTLPLPEKTPVTPELDQTQPTSIVPVDPLCVQPGPYDPVPLAPFEDYPNIFLQFLNAGGAPRFLDANLESLEIGNVAPSVAVADLTGDQKNDVVVSILEPNPQTYPPPGALLVYICLGDQYTLTHIELSDEFLSAPRILHLQDMDADGAAEVLFSSSTCGAHTCFESAQILAWNGVNFEARLDGVTDDLPYPDLQITDYDRDGIYNLEMIGSGYGSVGAGPQRSLTRIWEYNPDNSRWQPSQEILGASNYRIHTLHDADAAARKGEYDVALVLYDQVINNTDLLDWIDRDGERLDLGAYARYKLVVVYALQGDLERAQSFFDEIDSLYPENLPQRAYIDLAAEFLNGFAQGGQEAGCSAAHLFAAQRAAQILAPLGSQTYGYANPDYSPLDICP